MKTEVAKSSKHWIWFFAILTILALTAIIVPIVYNLKQQLKPEAVVAAREKWKASGITDYDLAYQERIDNEEHGTGYHAKIRGGRVVAATIDGEPLPEREWGRHCIDAMFDHIMLDLSPERAASTGRANYLSAHFDKQNGFPIRYVYRVRGTKSRVEWNIRLTPLK